MGHTFRVTREGSIEAGALLWRQGAARRITVAAKATYELTSAGTLVLVLPRPFEPNDPALAFTGDLAPFRARPEITFRGSVHVPVRGVGVHARLTVMRGPHLLVDRRIYAMGLRDAHGAVQPFSQMPLVFEHARGGAGDPANPAGVASPNVIDAARPARPGCLAPIPPAWPIRSAQLAGKEVRREGDALVLSEPFPWPYFQQAPFEQQLDGFDGSERVTLEHLSPRAPVLAFGLPRDAPSSTVDGRPIALRLDTIAIEGDAGLVSFTWRGTHELIEGASHDVRVSFASALAAQSTSGVDPRAIDVPLAPFLAAARPATTAAAPPQAALAAHATAPVDPRAIDAPVAPFLLAAQRSPGAGAAQPAASSVTPQTEAGAEQQPEAPAPAPAPTAPSLEDRLRRAGVSDVSVAAMRRALERRPAEPPPPEDD